MGKKTARKLEIAKAESTELLAANLVDDLRNLISQARAGVATAVNTALVHLYWQVGTRIRTEVLKNQRADFGKQICATLSHKLVAEFGTGFSHPNLIKMLAFAEVFPDQKILLTLSTKLSWSHFVELGIGFTFVGRQHRIVIDGEDFYIDLFFFHRTLRRLFAIDLKLGDFQASDKGQMELYLRWLEKHEMKPGEETPLGLILCAGKSSEKIELLQLGESGIHVASYVTELPPIEMLRARLHQAIIDARQVLEQRAEYRIG